MGLFSNSILLIAVLHHINLTFRLVLLHWCWKMNGPVNIVNYFVFTDWDMLTFRMFQSPKVSYWNAIDQRWVNFFYLGPAKCKNLYRGPEFQHKCVFFILMLTLQTCKKTNLTFLWKAWHGGHGWCMTIMFMNAANTRYVWLP